MKCSIHPYPLITHILSSSQPNSPETKKKNTINDSDIPNKTIQINIIKLLIFQSSTTDVLRRDSSRYYHCLFRILDQEPP